MAAAPWGVYELCELLKLCDMRIGLNVRAPRAFPWSDGSVKLFRLHSNPLIFQDFLLSEDAGLICNFLRVPLFQQRNYSHEEIFEIVVHHRFFHISDMAAQLENVVTSPFREILSTTWLPMLTEFMAWWNGTAARFTAKFKGSQPYTYEEVTKMSLEFFGLKDHREVLEFQPKPDVPEPPQEEVAELPERENDAELPEREDDSEQQQPMIISKRSLLIAFAGACACSAFVSAVVMLVAFRRQFR